MMLLMMMRRRRRRAAHTLQTLLLQMVALVLASMVPMVWVAARVTVAMVLALLVFLSLLASMVPVALTVAVVLALLIVLSLLGCGVLSMVGWAERSPNSSWRKRYIGLEARITGWQPVLALKKKYG